MPLMVARVILARHKEPEVRRVIIRRVFVHVVNYHPLRKWPSETDGSDFIGLTAVVVHGLLIASFPLVVARAFQRMTAGRTHRNASAFQAAAYHFRVYVVVLGNLNRGLTRFIATNPLFGRGGGERRARAATSANAELLSQNPTHLNLRYAQAPCNLMLIADLTVQGENLLRLDFPARRPLPDMNAMPSQKGGHLRLAYAKPRRRSLLRAFFLAQSKNGFEIKFHT